MTYSFDQSEATGQRHEWRRAGADQDHDPVVWAGPVAVFILTVVSALAWVALGAMVQAVF